MASDIAFETIPRIAPRIATATALSPVLVVFALVLLLPIEFSVTIGTLFITPTRLLFLLIALPLLVIWFSRGRLSAPDRLLAFFVIWSMLAYGIKRGTMGIEPAGQVFLDTTVAFLVARLFLRTPAEVVLFLKMTGLLIVVLGLLAIPEAIGHSRFLHDLPYQLTGVVYEIQDDTRLGLLRAASTFENPILFGLYCATFFSLMWYAGFSLPLPVVLLVGLALATALSLSSAPLLLLMLQGALIVLERLTRGMRYRVSVAACLVLAVIVFLETFSDRGVARLIASYLTFNPHTGYYRILQWEHGIDDVLANPYFGINIEDWTKPHWMTDSVDNNWLFLAMNGGLPAVGLLFSLLGLVAWRIFWRRKRMTDPLLRSLTLGWLVGMTALVLGACTVALFGKMQPVLFFMIGLGVALSEMPETPRNKDTRLEMQGSAPRHAPFTRFAERLRGGRPA